MLRCPLRASHKYASRDLALRDMRTAHKRDEVTGDGPGTESWIGLSLGMVVLDTLSGTEIGVEGRWLDLLAEHSIEEEDAGIIWALRCSLLHGYGLPRPDRIFGRRTIMSPDPTLYAVDTRRRGEVWISVPVICSRLVERIAFEAYDRWDTSLIFVNAALEPPG